MAKKRQEEKFGKYAVVDEDGEVNFFADEGNRDAFLKTVTKELRDARDTDGYGVCIYVKLKEFKFERPASLGDLKEVG